MPMPTRTHACAEVSGTSSPARAVTNSLARIEYPPFGKRAACSNEPRIVPSLVSTPRAGQTISPSSGSQTRQQMSWNSFDRGGTQGYAPRAPPHGAGALALTSETPMTPPLRLLFALGLSLWATCVLRADEAEDKAAKFVQDVLKGTLE